MPDWERNLDKLGIKLKTRQVDFALYRAPARAVRLRHGHDRRGDFTLPSAADYVDLYGSKAADEKGSNNFRGVKSAAVDHVLEAMAAATTLDELRDACRALDRVVMWNFWQVPELYFAAEPASLLEQVRHAGGAARSTSPSTARRPSSRAWPLITWWIKDPAQRPLKTALATRMLSYILKRIAADGADAARRADDDLHRDPVRARRAGRADHGRGARARRRRGRRLQGARATATPSRSRS